MNEAGLLSLLHEPALALAIRILLCLPFWWSGITRLVWFSGGVAEMERMGMRPAWLVNLATGILQLAGSASVILGIWGALGALALAGFTLMATFMAHRFWDCPAAERGPQFERFCEHIAIIAGLLLVAVAA